MKYEHLQIRLIFGRFSKIYSKVINIRDKEEVKSYIELLYKVHNKYKNESKMLDKYIRKLIEKFEKQM